MGTARFVIASGLLLGLFEQLSKRTKGRWWVFSCAADG